MLKKAVTLFLILSYFPFVLSAQVDSLMIKLGQEKVDTAKVNLLNQIAYFYQNSNIDSSFKYAKESSELATAIGFSTGYCLSCNITGGNFYMKSDYDNALVYFKKALLCYQKLNDKEWLPKIYTNLADVYLQQGKFNESAALYFGSLKIVESTGNQENLYKSYFALGTFYLKYNKMQQAKKYVNKAYDIAIALNKPDWIVRCLNNIGTIHFDQEDFDAALNFYYQALDINKEIGSERGIAFNYGNIANVYNYQGKFKESFQKLSEAKEIFQKLGEQKYALVANYNIGNLLYNNQKYGEAIKYLTTAVDGAIKLKEENLVLQMSKKLSETYAKNGDFSNAYRINMLKDSLNNKISTERNLELMEELEKKYETEKQEKELAQLRQEAIGLELAKKEQENERNYMVMGLMVLGGTGFYFGKKARQKTRASKILETAVKERTAELETQNGKMILLLKEVHHRVKNNLQLITSILNLQLSYEPDITAEQLADKWKNKIKCMALIHDRLINTNKIDKLPTKEYFSDLLNHIKGIHFSLEVDFQMDIEEHHLQIDSLVPCGLIFNEVVSNALKHNFMNGKKGLVKINFEKKGNLYHLVVSDNGIGLSEGFDVDNLSSMGLNLVTGLVDQLSGEIEFENKAEGGVVVRMSFPETELRKIM
jgi:two-component system, sensor histidine kinase PdtaS